MALSCLALGVTLGCDHSAPLKPVLASPSSGNKQLPFHQPAQPVSAPLDGAARTNPEGKSNGGVPFWSDPNGRVLAAGTLLTVQLERSLPTKRVHAGEDFAASVTAPIVVEGATLIERGAKVTGRVEAARARRGAGYVELKLSSIMVGGTPIALQTSSLFTRGKRQSPASEVDPSTKGPSGMRVPRGRRLTFRLSAPVNLNIENLPERAQSANNGTR